METPQITKDVVSPIDNVDTRRHLLPPHSPHRRLLTAMWSLQNRPSIPASMFLRAAAIAFAFLTLLLTWVGVSHQISPSQSDALWSQVSQYLPSSSQDTPTPLHRTDNIMLIMKTGASVIDARLPAHLNTTLPQAKHLLIFSSMNQTFGGYPVQDILPSVSEKWRLHHKDFEVYRELQKLAATENASREKIAELASGKAWDLDKWKFMPMVFEAYEQAPEEVEWFVMMEADTSLSWTNMVWWLSGLDPRKPRYMGAPNYCVGKPCNGQLFAHGGSGIFWSRYAVAQMKALRQAEGPEIYDRRWEEVTNATCCGDIVLAEAFEEAGVKLTKAGPMVQGATLESFTWYQRDWCRPPITWHHVGAEEVEEIHEFSERWAKEQRGGVPYFYSDIYAEFLAGRTREERLFWDNKSRSKQYQEGNESKEACIAACKEDKKCVQWMYAAEEMGSRCMFGEQFTIGEELEEAEEEAEKVSNWTSGWIQEKVDKMIEDFGPC